MAEPDGWYYDNGDEVPIGEDADRELSVERVYCLDWERFGEDEWDALMAIYGELPGWQHDSGDLPRWFSTDERKSHLWASVEPSGLQVAGVLRASQWRAWDSMFRAAVARLPLRAVL